MEKPSAQNMILRCATVGSGVQVSVVTGKSMVRLRGPSAADGSGMAALGMASAVLPKVFPPPKKAVDVVGSSERVPGLFGW